MIVEWQTACLVIADEHTALLQATGDRFLDIRALKLYKSNHMEATSPRCNAYCSQTGPARLALFARRDVWRGEEILWEYSKTMQHVSFFLHEVAWSLSYGVERRSCHFYSSLPLTDLHRCLCDSSSKYSLPHATSIPYALVKPRM